MGYNGYLINVLGGTWQGTSDCIGTQVSILRKNGDAFEVVHREHVLIGPHPTFVQVTQEGHEIAKKLIDKGGPFNPTGY